MTGLLRPAGPADREVIARIYRDASVAALGTAAKVASIQAAAGGRHAMWSPLVRSDPAYAMDTWDDGQVRGFMSVGPATSGESTVGHLFALYVEPARWGSGIGGALLEQALVHLRACGMQTAELWVQEENTRARTFYEHRNWTSNGDTSENDRGKFTRYTTAL